METENKEDRIVKLENEKFYILMQDFIPEADNERLREIDNELAELRK